MTSIIHIVYLVLIVVVVWLSIKKLAPGEVSQSPLSTSEKIIVWLLCIVNPVFAVIVFYYGWRKRLPAKAKESNRIAFIVFFSEVVVGLGLYYLGFVALLENSGIFVDLFNVLLRLVSGA